MEADLSFHRLIGEASQNPLVGALLDSVGDLLHAQRTRYVSVPGAASRAQRHHRKILEVLELRDADAAFEAMADHLRQVVRDVQRAKRSMQLRVEDPSQIGQREDKLGQEAGFL